MVRLELDNSDSRAALAKLVVIHAGLIADQAMALVDARRAPTERPVTAAIVSKAPISPTKSPIACTPELAAKVAKLRSIEELDAAWKALTKSGRPLQHGIKKRFDERRENLRRELADQFAAALAECKTAAEIGPLLNVALPRVYPDGKIPEAVEMAIRQAKQRV
jgi:hypothetical protein